MSNTAQTDLLVSGPWVVLGEGTVAEAPCILGKTPRGCAPGERELRVGANGTIRPFTTIYGGTTVGDRFQTGQGVSIREDNMIGDDVSVGTNSVLEAGNRIGDRVRIHTGCFLELVTIEDDVFIAPNVVFADDLHPPCPRYEECVGGPCRAKGRAHRLELDHPARCRRGRRLAGCRGLGGRRGRSRRLPRRGRALRGPIKRVDEIACTAGFYDKALRLAASTRCPERGCEPMAVEEWMSEVRR